MTTFGKAYIAVDLRKRFHGTEWLELAEAFFAMHMAFDPEDSARTRDYVENEAWAIARELYPNEFANIGSAHETEEELDRAVDIKDNYHNQIMEYLTHRWLASS